MKERVFLSNNQDGIIENYWMMHFLNVTDVLTNRVNCSGSTFNLTLFWRVVRDLRALLIKPDQGKPETRTKVFPYFIVPLIFCIHDKIKKTSVPKFEKKNKTDV